MKGFAARVSVLCAFLSIAQAPPALAADAGPVLPPYEFADDPVAAAATVSPVRVDEIRFRGHRALPTQALDAVAARFTGRNLGFRELAELQDALTGVYVSQGYITSGVVVRSVAGGVLTVDVVEGRLTEVQVADAGRFSSRYLSGYLGAFGPMDPVNVFDLERRLQTLQQDPHVARVEAELLPGLQAGESILRLKAVETRPWDVYLEAANHQSPSIGEWHGRVALTALNISGRGDDLRLGGRASEGLTELSLEYDMALTAGDTRVTFYAYGTDSEIVTAPFDDLDIEAETHTVGARLSYPLRRHPAGHTRISLSAEWRESETFLLGSGFSFVDGPDEGLAQVAALRVGWEHLYRGQRNVLAAGITASFGVDAFGATQAAGATPDGSFRKLVAQAQWARRLDFLQSQLVLRSDLQLTQDALLGMEQIALGGRWSVRGYRENTLIRDGAVIASAEWRIPLLRDVRGASRLELRPFFDYSRSWNHGRDEVGPRALRSAGLGLAWQPLRGLQAEAYWGEALNDIDYPGEYSLQDDGVHVRFTWEIL